MGDGPIHPIIHLITIDTMINTKGLSNGHELKTLRVDKVYEDN